MILIITLLIIAVEILCKDIIRRTFHKVTYIVIFISISLKKKEENENEKVTFSKFFTLLQRIV